MTYIGQLTFLTIIDVRDGDFTLWHVSVVIDIVWQEAHVWWLKNYGDLSINFAKSAHFQFLMSLYKSIICDIYQESDLRRIIINLLSRFWFFIINSKSLYFRLKRAFRIFTVYPIRRNTPSSYQLKTIFTRIFEKRFVLYKVFTGDEWNLLFKLDNASVNLHSCSQTLRRHWCQEYVFFLAWLSDNHSFLPITMSFLS